MSDHKKHLPKRLNELNKAWKSKDSTAESRKALSDNLGRSTKKAAKNAKREKK